MLLKTNEKTLATKFQMSAFKDAYNVVEQWNRPDWLASAAIRVMTVCVNFQFTLKRFHLTDILTTGILIKKTTLYCKLQESKPKSNWNSAVVSVASVVRVPAPRCVQ